MSVSVYRQYAPDELGKDGYPPEWHATIKHAVRAEAGHRCVRCGHPYTTGTHGKGEWTPCDERCTHRLDHDDDRRETYPGSRAMEARWRILTVHHLDGDKANCRWWNLAALCQRCHLRIQGRVVMARIWPWEHSEWFRPYVAGYYALVYLNEELTRGEALARMDELLALERFDTQDTAPAVATKKETPDSA